MLTGKQRSYLKSLAHELEPTVYVGKSGMTENIIKEMEIGFETRELVKIKLQEGCDLSKDEVADMIIEQTVVNSFRPSAARSPCTEDPRTTRRSFCRESNL